MLLEVNNLSVSFGNVKAVDDISFELNKGEILGVVGESGSGKSVTALSVLGLLPYPRAQHTKKSSIKFEGKELIGASEKELEKVRGGDISFIFQEPMSSLNPLHTIEKQIAEALILHQRMSVKHARAEVLRLLKLTGIKNAAKRMRAYPHELSGGQRQRVMIAMAIANNPKILIADEPTTALDVTIQAQIVDLLLELKEKIGMSIIFISHDLQLVRKISDRICIMKSGKIVEQGKTEDIFRNPKSEYTLALINSLMLLKKQEKISDEVLLKADKIKVVFPVAKNFWGKVVDEIRAVDGVSVELHKASTLGIVGESGSGKTTLGFALANLNKYSGSVYLNNININQQDRNFRKAVQVVFQDPYNSLNPRMSVAEIVGEGLDVHFPEMKKTQKQSLIAKTLKEVGLGGKDVLNRYPHEFSGGQRQRIAIARAIILKPELLILDEPTSALDVTVQAQIIKLLQDIQQNFGISYVFISHDMRAIRAMSDVIAVMKNGKIVEQGLREEIFENPKDEYTRSLISASF